MSKDTRNTIIFSSVAAALLILSIVFICLGVSKFNGLFAQKDLGVEYDQSDVEKLDEKMEIEILPPTPVVTDDSGNTTDPGSNGAASVTGSGNSVPDKTPSNDDYTIVYTEYAQKSVELDATEATVLFNERIQIFPFCENAQFKPSPDGTLAMSAMCDVREALAYLFPKEQIKIPEGTPASVPFDAVVNISVKDNVIQGTITSIGSGISSIIPIKPGQKFTGTMDKVNKEMPELFIKDMHVNDKGMLVIDGNLPSKGQYVPKGQ